MYIYLVYLKNEVLSKTIVKNKKYKFIILIKNNTVLGFETHLDLIT